MIDLPYNLYPKCSDCKLLFISQKDLFSHRKNECDLIKFKCKICKLKFTNNITLYNHIQKCS